MTDRERRQRRLQRERRMYRSQKKSKKGWFAFRSYVTIVLAGAFLLLSFLHTETSLAVCQEIKETIAYQIPNTTLLDARNLLQAFFQVSEDGDISVFYETNPLETTEEDATDEVFYYAPDIYDSP